MSVVRLADPSRRHARVAAEVERRVAEVLRGGRYVGGPVVDHAERALAGVFGWALGVGVNSGTDALIYALLALGVGPGDEVVVPAVTFFATAGAVVRVGATPVIADVRADLPLIDPARLPIGPRTRAIVVVHLFGEGATLGPVPVPVVDDAAQVAGADPPPRVGVIGATSFYPTKTLGAAGDGGLVLTDDARLADAVRRLTHHGMTEPNVAERVSGHVGGNSRLDAIQAAVLLAHLDDLPARVAARRHHAEVYDAAFASCSGVRLVRRSRGHPVHQYLVRAERRDALRAGLAARGVETGVYYPRSLAAQPALAEHARATPNADAWCAEALALPVHECLTPSDVGYVVDAVLAEVGR